MCYILSDLYSLHKIYSSGISTQKILVKIQDGSYPGRRNWRMKRKEYMNIYVFSFLSMVASS